MNEKNLTENYHRAKDKPTEKAKPAARRGRKATGLSELKIAGLPGRNIGNAVFFGQGIRVIR
jgi:hypothetical protein